MPKKNIFISTSSFGQFSREPLELLEKAGYQYALNPHGRVLTPEETVTLTGDSVGLIAGTEALNAEVLGRLERLRVISRCGAGMDNVDLAGSRAKGIKVYNTPDAPTVAVAELTLGLMLDLLRNISVVNREVHDGLWKKRMGSLLSGKKIGLVGFGRIGKKVAQMLKFFDCQLAYCDPVVQADPSGIQHKVLPDLLAWADIVSIHISTAEQIIGRKELEMFRPGAWIVNVSRGGVIDEDALHDLLKNGQIAGAALDVFAREPYQGPLTGLENAILTPHIGSYAKEARITMEITAVKNLLEGLGNGA